MQSAIRVEEHVGREGGVGVCEVEVVRAAVLLDGQELLLVAVDGGEPRPAAMPVELEDGGAGGVFEDLLLLL